MIGDSRKLVVDNPDMDQFNNSCKQFLKDSLKEQVKIQKRMNAYQIDFKGTDDKENNKSENTEDMDA